MSPSFEHVLEVYKDAKDPHGNPEFVGYGNPDSDVLILGQEVTHKPGDEATHTPGDENWENFYKDNCEQWQKTLKFELVAHPGIEGIAYTFPAFFNPRNPFYPKPYSRKRSDPFAASATWYNYQKIMDAVCPCQDGIINMFDHCFITEMSNLCSKHNPLTKDAEKSIAQRFDLMKETVDFWSHFKVIVLACGHYADVIANKSQFPSLERDLFGEDGKCVFTRQLSIVSNDEIARIQQFIKERLA